VYLVDTNAVSAGASSRLAPPERHGLTILSRNLRHFMPLGVPVLDPFDNVPPV
jgi:hypothetical protein